MWEVQKQMEQQVLEYNQELSMSKGTTNGPGCSNVPALAPDPATASEVVVDSTDNDFVLAQMLQYEYDLEHDQQLEMRQKHINKNSKCESTLIKYLHVII